MTKRYLVMAICLVLTIAATAQKKGTLLQGRWNASLIRNDGKQIPFMIDLQYDQHQLYAYIVNGQERIKTEKITFDGDSAIISMPVFESSFRVRKISADSLSGVWISGAAGGDIIIPFSAYLAANRPAGKPAEASGNIGGKWSMEITRPNQTKRPAIGSFTQKGNMISGSILTPSADYRYLEGSIYKDSILFSTFDGSHAMLFLARIDGDKMSGTFYNGANGKEDWVAERNAQAALPQPATPVTAVKNDESLNFSFRNIDGQTISINDERYKGKVVIIQIMGSWCPNCMDETAFLSEYYRKNKDRGLEVIALAYELSTDENRSVNSIRKFRERFNVPYQMLNTGVTASDPEKAAKTIPQLTALKSFPTTIFVDREGKISVIKTNFYGPAAKEYHEQFKRDFDETIKELLNK